MLLSARKQLGAPSSGGYSAGNLPRFPGSPLPTFVEMPVRSVLDWTPEQVGSAMLTADQGLLMRAADLCERLMCDARIRGILGTRTYGLFGLPMEFHGPARQIKDLKGTEDEPGSWWRMFPETELARLVAWWIMLGIGIAQRVHNPDRKVGEPDNPILRVWHPRWLRYQWATNISPEKWFLQTTGGEIEIHPGDGEWILFCDGLSRPWANGAWRALSEAWIQKQFAKHDRMRYTEVAGTPVRVGVAPQGANEKTRKAWLRQLKAMGRDTAMVLPAGYDLKAVQIGGDGWQVYGATIQLSDEDIAITLAGQLVTTQGTTGFSSGNIHEKIAHSLIKCTAEATTTCLHEQALKPWAGANYGTSEKACYACWDIEKPEDKKAKAETIKAFGEAIDKTAGALAAIGKRMAIEEMAEEYGMELEDLPPEVSKSATVPLAPTDIVKIVRVDEARAGVGLGPWGDADGQLSVSEFDSKNSPKISIRGQGEMSPVDGQPVQPGDVPAPGAAPGKAPGPPGAPFKKAPPTGPKDLAPPELP